MRPSYVIDWVLKTLQLPTYPAYWIKYLLGSLNHLSSYSAIMTYDVLDEVFPIRLLGMSWAVLLEL